MADYYETSMRLTRTVYPDDTGAEMQQNSKAQSKSSLYGLPDGSSQYNKLTKRVTQTAMNNMELQAVAGAIEDETAANSLSVGLILTEFMDFTTSHGITHTYNAKGIIKKCVWGFLTLTSLVLLALHLWLMISGFIKYDTVTNVNVNEARVIDFPAVTICNNNGVKRSNMPSGLDDLVKNKKQGLLNGTDEKVSKNVLIKTISEEISLLNSSAKVSLGYNYSDLVIYCSYNGENCYESDFWTFFDSTYGNCYSFNTGKYGSIQQSSIAGPSYGLSLILNIGIYEYVKFLTEDAGVNVVVHDQKAMPFPGHSGISATPGQVNNIAIKMLNTTRLSGNYGNCTKLDSNEDNMYFVPYNVSYTQWACLRTCYQKELVRSCKCFDPDLPYDFGTIVFDKIPEAKGPCRLTNSTNVACITEVASRFADRTLKCDTCYQPCNEITYEGVLSTSTFPALSYIDDFISVLTKSHPNLVKKLQDEYGKENINSGLQTNFLKLNIFYQSMTYTTHEHVPSYDTYQFASDFGGAWGLWIGWSILTIFELIELGIDLLVFVCYRSNKCKSSK